MKRKTELITLIDHIINEGLRAALREKDATVALELFMAHIGQSSGSDRMYIFEGFKGQRVSNTFEWCAQGVTKEKNNLQDVPFEAVEWWYKTFEKYPCLVIESVNDLKETQPLTYEYLKPQNIDRLIAAPLILEGKIIGFYGVDNPSSEIMAVVEEGAEMTGHFITSLLERQHLMKQLEKLSFEDSLTGVKNRHAMNWDIAALSRMEKVGFIYCDVLGLKRVNDNEGHKAGDALLIRAAECLKQNFRKTEIYRIGGDEFLVFCVGVNQESFEQRVEKLRNDMVENNAAMSIGTIWKELVCNADEVIAEADKLMYAEKQAYYAAKNKKEILRE